MKLHTDSGRFQLVRHFTLASVAMIAVVAGALMYFQHQQVSFFKQVQDDQISFFGEVQEAFVTQQKFIATKDLLAIHEAGNVNLTRLFANALWEQDFAPFVSEASQIPISHCRAMADIEVDGKKKPSPAKKACLKDVGRQIQNLADFEEINAKVFGAMKKSTVLKIKVFDLRGLTVYSSDHSQIGDDKLSNKGWQSAIKGVPASALSHRGKFDAFEGTLTERDVISSYLPVYAPGTNDIVGVFEVYSDVTEFLSRIKKTSDEISLLAAQNQAQIEQDANKDQAKVDQASNLMLAIVVALMLILFVALFAIVRRADKIMAEQEQEREEAQQQLSQAEKMASLGQMVAGVAHQLNTPLAFSHSNVSMVMDSLKDYRPASKIVTKLAGFLKNAEGEKLMLNFGKSKGKVIELEDSLPETEMLEEMLGDTLKGIEQMGELVENLLNFTRLDRSKTSEFDVNEGLKNVVYIAKSVMPTRIHVDEQYGNTPPVICNPSQLNQVFLNLLNNASQAIEDDGTITVTSVLNGDNIEIRFADTGRGIAPDVLPHIFDMYFTTKKEGEGTGMGLAIAKSIVNEHGGDISVETEVGKGSTFTVTIPMARTQQAA